MAELSTDGVFGYHKDGTYHISLGKGGRRSVSRRFAFLLVLVAVVAAGGYLWWLNTRPEPAAPDTAGLTSSDTARDASLPDTGPAGDERQVDYPLVTIEMENGAQIQIELYPDVAPNTVANFVYLARQGFYDGLIFHRVVPGFVIQGGDPTGTGFGGPGYTIFGEFTSNGFENNLSHTRGVVSMARLGNDPNSAGSQFFIVLQDATHLNGDYAAFGRVVSGMEEADRIASVPRDFRDRPLVEQRMVRVTVDWDEEDVVPEKYGE